MRKIAFVVACTIWLLLSSTLLSEAVLPGLSGKVTSQTAPSSEGNLQVLSSPHILVSDNKEAKIQVGRQVPIATSETLTTTAPAQTTTTIQYKDIGIILKVKPQINEGKEAEQAG